MTMSPRPSTAGSHSRPHSRHSCSSDVTVSTVDFHSPSKPQESPRTRVRGTFRHTYQHEVARSVKQEEENKAYMEAQAMQVKGEIAVFERMHGMRVSAEMLDTPVREPIDRPPMLDFFSLARTTPRSRAPTSPRPKRSPRRSTQLVAAPPPCVSPRLRTLARSRTSGVTPRHRACLRPQSILDCGRPSTTQTASSYQFQFTIAEPIFHNNIERASSPKFSATSESDCELEDDEWPPRKTYVPSPVYQDAKKKKQWIRGHVAQNRFEHREAIQGFRQERLRSMQQRRKHAEQTRRAPPQRPAPRRERIAEGAPVRGSLRHLGAPQDVDGALTMRDLVPRPKTPKTVRIHEVPDIVNYSSRMDHRMTPSLHGTFAMSEDDRVEQMRQIELFEIRMLDRANADKIEQVRGGGGSPTSRTTSAPGTFTDSD